MLIGTSNIPKQEKEQLNKQIILPIVDVQKLISDVKFSNIEEYISYLNSCGISPYKKDIRKSPSFGKGLGDSKMNHYSIRDADGRLNFGNPSFRFYITNKRKWMLNKIKHGV